jgi:hypothetical protein
MYTVCTIVRTSCTILQKSMVLYLLYKISYCNIAGFVAIWDLQSYCLYEKSDDPPERKL